MTSPQLLSDYLTPEELAAELNVCETTLWRWRRLREGPAITKVGRKVLYRRDDVSAWLIANKRAA